MFVIFLHALTRSSYPGNPHLSYSTLHLRLFTATFRCHLYSLLNSHRMQSTGLWDIKVESPSSVQRFNTRVSQQFYSNNRRLQ